MPFFRTGTVIEWIHKKKNKFNLRYTGEGEGKVLYVLAYSNLKSMLNNQRMPKSGSSEDSKAKQT